MDIKREFINCFTKYKDIIDNYKFLWHLLSSPKTRAMEVVADPSAQIMNPFNFMGFAFSLLLITQVASPITTQGSELENTLAMSIGVIVYILFYSGITYLVFKKFSKVERSFDDFLLFSSVIIGIQWMLNGTVGILMLVNLELAQLFFVGSSLYVLYYSVLAYASFWDMKIKDVVIYSVCSFFAAVFAIIVLAIIIS